MSESGMPVNHDVIAQRTAAAGAARAGDRPAHRRGAVAVPATAVGLVAGILACLGSWHVSLWMDEAATLSGAQRSPGQLFDLASHIDAVHAAYYLFMHFWINVFGSSPLSLRLPSAIAVGLTAAGVFVLTRMVTDYRAAWFAGLAFAVLPRATWMGIEARSFAFSALIATWASVVLVSATRRSSVLNWCAYTVLCAAGIAVNIYVALLLCAHGVSLLLIRSVTWRIRWTWLAAAAIAVILASPVVLAAAQQSQQIGESELGLISWIRNIAINQWFLGSTPTVFTQANGLTTDVGSSLWKPASVVLAVIAWGLMIYGFVASRVAGVKAEVYEWLLPWLLLPTLLVLLYSILGQQLYNPRYFSFVTPVVGVLVGIGIATLRVRWLRITAVLLIVISAAPIYLSQRQVYAKNGSDWVNAAAFVAANKLAGEAVYFSPLDDVPPGAPVESNLRVIARSYPDDFVGLQDITLEETGAADASLNGRSRSLDDSIPKLAGVQSIWVLRRADYPAAAVERDDAILAGLGFTAEQAWQGPQTTVTELTR